MQSPLLVTQLSASAEPKTEGGSALKGSAMNLEMKSEIDGDSLLITLTGELTRVSIDAFKGLAIEQLEQDSYNVAVQCADLSYIDSAGLGAFIYVRKIVHDRGKQFYLTAVNGWLKKFLEVTGLEATLTNCSKE